MPTREELIKIREENLKPTKERRAKIAAKLEDEYNKKQSHTWSRSLHRTQTGVQPMIGNCQKCGVNYYLFKGRPVYCPNQ